MSIELQHIRFYFTVLNDWSGWDNYTIMPPNALTDIKQDEQLQEQEVVQRWIVRLEYHKHWLKKVADENQNKISYYKKLATFLR